MHALKTGRLTTVRFHDGTTKTICLDEHFKDSYRDEYTGQALPRRLIEDAVHDELSYFNDHVWTIVPIDHALADKKAKLIGTRWVMCKNNDNLDQDCRARLVAQEVNLFNEESVCMCFMRRPRRLRQQWCYLVNGQQNKKEMVCNLS